LLQSIFRRFSVDIFCVNSRVILVESDTSVRHYVPNYDWWRLLSTVALPVEPFSAVSVL